MKREDFKIIPKFYATSSLVMVVYNNTIIASVEIYCNYQSVKDGKKDTYISTKDKRDPKAISAECESIIKKYIG